MIRSKRHQAHRAFTLAELLIATTVVSVVIAALMPAVQSAREASRQAQCADNMARLGLAFQSHHDSHQAFPIGADNLVNWRVALLPHVRKYSVYDRLVLDGKANFQGDDVDINTRALGGLTLQMYVCPSSDLDPNMDPGWNDNRYQYHHYMGVGGAVGVEESECSHFFGYSCDNGALLHNQQTRLGDFGDGSSHTLLLGEQSALVAYTGEPMEGLEDGVTMSPGGYFGGWHGPGNKLKANEQTSMTAGLAPMLYPPNSPCPNAWDCGFSFVNSTIFASKHPGGIVTCRADGSVDFLADTVDLETLREISTRSGAK